MRNALYISLLAMVFLSSGSHAQTGSYSATVIDEHSREPLDSVLIVVNLRSMTWVSHLITDSTGSFVLHDLPLGSYQIRLSKSNYHHRNYFFSIEKSEFTKSDSIILYSTTDYRVSQSEDLQELILNINFFSPSLLHDETLFKSLIEFEMSSAIPLVINPNLKLVFEMSPFKLLFYRLQNDTMNTQMAYENENYSGWFYSFKGYTRLSGKGQEKGFFVDSGLGYDFPVWFRYNYTIEQNHKGVIKRIHRYNDLYALARAGYGPLSFHANYKFFNTLKPEFTAMPKIIFGASVIVPFY